MTASGGSGPVSSDKPVCDLCGAPSRVHISNQLPGRGKVMSHYCLACADGLDAQEVAPPAPTPPRLGDAAAYIAVGVFITFLSLAADWLQLGATADFGLYQRIGLVISVVLFLAGAILRVSSLLAISLLMGALVLCADYLVLGDGEQFGIYQIIGLVFGIVVVARGIGLARRVA